MIQNNPGRNRLRKKNSIPSSAEIAMRRRQIQSTWTQRERKLRRTDFACPESDLRYQARLRFLQFLIEREAQNS